MVECAFKLPGTSKFGMSMRERQAEELDWSRLGGGTRETLW